MMIYFRVDNLSTHDEFFGFNYRDFVIKIRDFFLKIPDDKYGDEVQVFFPTIVLRDQAYYKLIEEDPSQFRKFQYYPKVSFKKKDKVLQSFVEVHHEDVRKAKTIGAVEKIIAKAFLYSIVNANENAKQRIDYKQMEIDLIGYYAINGIPF